MSKPLKVSDEKGVRDREKDLENQATSLDFALRDIMSTPSGRAWVWSVLEQASMFGNAFDPDSAVQTAFNLGEQNVGKKLLAQIVKVCPELYAKATTEAGDG